MSNQRRNPSDKGTVRLSAAQARQIALKAQGLWSRNLTSLSHMSDTLGAVQLDTISVLARSHELIPYARLGAVEKSAIENHYWSSKTATHFEYWSHAACIIPVSNWPLYSFRRNHHQINPPTWHDVSQRQLNSMLKRIEMDGPISTSDVGGGRKSSYWWDWSENKSALEHLLLTGEVTVTQRTGFKRMYDVSNRAIPSRYFFDREEHDAKLELLGNSLNMLGVATKLDLLDVPHLKPSHVRDVWDEFLAGVIEVNVEGWDEPAFTTSYWLEELSNTKPRSQVLLSPFDSLIWYRPRMERLFGMHYRIEAYTPAHKRVYGYFAMPVLVGDELVARVDPGREKTGSETVLVAKKVTFQSNVPSAKHLHGVAQALREAKKWVGASTIRIDEVKPASAKTQLRKLVS